MERFEYVVVGGGPAGLQLGWHLQKQGRSYVILDGADHVGAFFSTLPRSRQLISFNRVNSLYDDPEIQLRWDWNSLLCDYEMPFKEFSSDLYPSADDLVAYLQAFAARYALQVRLNKRVQSVVRPDGGDFHVTTTDGQTIACRALVLATGVSAPYIPDIPGIELVTEAYETASLDPADYAGDRVLVLGKGNSAFEFVEEILDTPSLIHLASPQSIRFAWDSHHPGHLRANYASILDTYQLKLLNGSLDCTVDRIHKDGDTFLVDVTYTHADGETETLVYDRVIRATGFRFDASFLAADLQPSLAHAGRLPAMTTSWESVEVPDLWFAGTLMQSRDFKRAGSTFIDGFRYNVRTLGRLLDARYHDQPLHADEHASGPTRLTAAIAERISRTSGLWAQFGYLCDVVVVDQHADRAYHFHELPSELAHQHADALGDHWYRITYEWGEGEGDIFAVKRHPNHRQAGTSRFLHPVIRRYRGAELVEEHHMLEDLFGMYTAKGAVDVFRAKNGRNPAEYHTHEHEQPLLDFFRRHHEPADPSRPPLPRPHSALASRSTSSARAVEVAA